MEWVLDAEVLAENATTEHECYTYDIYASYSHFPPKRSSPALRQSLLLTKAP